MTYIKQRKQKSRDRAKNIQTSAGTNKTKKKYLSFLVPSEYLEILDP